MPEILSGDIILSSESFLSLHTHQMHLKSANELNSQYAVSESLCHKAESLFAL